MSDPKRNLALVVLSIVAALIFLGTAFMTPDESGDEEKLETRLQKQLESSLQSQKDSTATAKSLAAELTELKRQDKPLPQIFNQLGDNLRTLRQIGVQSIQTNDAVLTARSLFINPSSPIKVRGGSMTFFTADPGKWRKGTLRPGNPFCSLIDDAGLVQFEGVSVPVASFPWTMKIYGTIPADQPGAPPGRFHESPRGIMIKGYNTPCKAGETGDSVTIEPFGTDADFYPTSLDTVHGKKEDNQRFRDRSSDCKSDPSGDIVNSGPKIGKGDRELCERMRKIELVSGLGNPAPPSLQCADGDCELFIGTP